MKLLTGISIFISTTFLAQNVKENLDRKVKEMFATSSAMAANLSFYVSDDAGNVVYDYNGYKGLSTASTQKIFTAAAALETLGANYQFKTMVSYKGVVKNGVLEGDLYIASNGDPTLGSWRYENYKPENFKQSVLDAVKKSGIKKIIGNLIVDDSYFDIQSIPNGWPWGDLGNYYGAGTFGVNWRENQFDIHTNGTQIKKFSYNLENVQWVNEMRAGGNSDQSIIYTAPHSDVAYINGVLPVSKAMTISGATPNPPLQLAVEIKKLLSDNQIAISGKITTYYNEKIQGNPIGKATGQNVILEYKSPTLDKIVYWFLRKSVNLYGEALLRTMAKEKRNSPSYETGVAFLKDFWKAKGINPMMINFADGSGLSPQNYVSAKAQVQALLYAKKQKWFNAFFDGFPNQNNMRMKSGTIKNCKSFAGYHTSKSGKNYTFSIILNNYQGGNISQALFNILDELK